MKTDLAKTLRELVNILINMELSYEPENKKVFARVAQKALKQVATALEFKEFKVSFNPSGIASSGDALLMGMWNDTEGIYFTIDKDMGPSLMFRSIKHLRDYSGGGNRWLHVDDLLDTERLITQLLSVRKGEPTDTRIMVEFMRSQEPVGTFAPKSSFIEDDGGQIAMNF